MIVRVTSIDSKIPNLALMRIASYHTERGDTVHFSKSLVPELSEPEYDIVYGSSIFKFSHKRIERFLGAFPNAIIGGTGTSNSIQVEDVCPGPEKYTYSIYPDFESSLGFTARGCRLSCKFCLTPGNMIITGDGLKKIEDVKVGDLVLTHLGKYRRVVKKLRRWYEGSVVKLNAGALSKLFPTEVTDNHNIWTRHISCYGSKHPTPGQQLTLFNWIEAGKLEAKQFPKAREVFAYPRTLSEDDLKIAPGAFDWQQYDVGTGLSELVDIKVDAQLMELLGFYLAEGHLSDNGRPYLYSTIFSFGHSDTERVYALRVAETLRAYGLNPAASPVPTGTRVTAYSSRFARWLDDQFSTGSSKKQIPLWVRLLPVERLKELLQAWCEGDGWFHIKRGSRTWKIITCSPNLAVSCREMALKCGYSATINKHYTSDVIQGRKVNVQPAYTVIFHEPTVGVKNCTTYDSNYVYHAINQSSTREFAGYVHNLEVEEIHSFCTPAFAISNCVVPVKEGKPRSVNTIEDLYRGDKYPRHIQLLDNDFFGQPEDQWRARVREIQDGKFKVCFNQGLNVRLITDAGAEALADIPYYDDQFKARRLYTAWDNAKDFKIFFRGVDTLERYGVPPKHLLAYMLIGFAKGETMEEIEWRHKMMKDRGIFPFPMVYDRSRPELRAFARWAIRFSHACSFKEYNTNIKKQSPSRGDLFTDDDDDYVPASDSVF